MAALSGLNLFGPLVRPRKVKLRELETSVRVLSGRSDLHRALACARQELASERVTTVYLRGELDLHKRMLSETEGRVTELRSHMDVLQNTLDDAKVAESVRALPTVPALALVEHFAGVMSAARGAVESLRKDLGYRGRYFKKPQRPVEAPASVIADLQDEHGLSKRFRARVEVAQVEEREERWEEEVGEMKEEVLKVKLDAAGAVDAVRREKEALEEAHRLAVAGLERKLVSANAEVRGSPQSPLSPSLQYASLFVA